MAWIYAAIAVGILSMLDTRGFNLRNIIVYGVLGYLIYIVQQQAGRLKELGLRLTKLEQTPPKTEAIASHERAEQAPPNDKSSESISTALVEPTEETMALRTPSNAASTNSTPAPVSPPENAIEESLAAATAPEAVRTTSEAKTAAVSTPASTSASTSGPTSPATSLSTQPPTTTPRREPSLIETLPVLLATYVKRYFTEGNLSVRVGIIILFFGVSFLAKYSIDNSIIPIEIRLAAIALGGITMLAIGWRLRFKRPDYALIMQGGAIAVLYLTIFASFKIYTLLPAALVFPLLIVFSFLAMSLAVLQDSRALAVAAIAGGFAAPILSSTGSGNHVGLFAYYTALNLAVFAVAWKKSWRLLNLVGFGFTFVISGLWGVTSYQPEHFASAEPFLIIFFAIYLCISVLFALKQPPNLKGYVDGSLVFGLPFIAFGFQAELLRDSEYGLAISTLIAGLIYLSLAKGLWQRTQLRALSEAFMAIGLIFSTLTIPFALSGEWTAASWAMEGAGLIWIGLRQQRKFAFYFGMLVQIGGGLIYLSHIGSLNYLGGFLSSQYLSTLIVSLSALFSAYILNMDKIKTSSKRPFDLLFLIWALAWWYICGLSQIEDYQSEHHRELYMLFLCVSALALHFVHIKVRWQLLNFSPWLLLAPLPVFALTVAVAGPADVISAASWLLAIGLCFAMLRSTFVFKQTILLEPLFHTLSFLLGVFVTALLVNIAFDQTASLRAWQLALISSIFIAALYFINRYQRWPISVQGDSYHKQAASVIAGALLIFFLVNNIASYASPAPLPYIPLLNPLDIAQAIGLMVLFSWFQKFGHTWLKIKSSAYLPIAAALGFVWFNSLLFKTLHVYIGVQYTPAALLSSATVQTAVSISWTLISLGVMIAASRLQSRHIWIAGAGLAGLVVIKLFLFDLIEKGTIERIVSFLGVGILLMVVGYFSPVPPSAATNDAAPDDDAQEDVNNDSDANSQTNNKTPGSPSE